MGLGVSDARTPPTDDTDDADDAERLRAFAARLEEVRRARLDHGVADETGSLPSVLAKVVRRIAQLGLPDPTPAGADAPAAHTARRSA